MSPTPFPVKRPEDAHCLVFQIAMAHWPALICTIALIFAMGPGKLLGSSLPYPDEIQNPHIVSSQLQFGSFGAEPGALNESFGICVSAAGDIYIADTFNHRVQVFNKAGKPLCTWGEAGSAPGQFVAPRAIAVSSKGEVFVADTGNDRIQVFDKLGTLLRRWGSFGDQAGEFKEPSGIAVDANRVYVVDQANERLQVFNLDGTPILELGKYGDRPGEFNQPSDVTVDGEANFYVADSFNDRIQMFDPLGRPLRSWGSSGSHNGLLATPTGLSYGDGKIYVADSVNHRIQVFDPEGGFLFQWGRHPYPAHAGSGMLHYPSRIAVAPKDDFAVVLEPSEYRCQSFGTQTVQRAENVNGFVWWQQPEGLHFGACIQCKGPLVTISEPDTQSVLVFDDSAESPKLITKLGGHGKEPGQLIFPSGIEIGQDSSEIYVADSGNYRLEEFALQRSSSTGSFLTKVSSFVRAMDFRKMGRFDGEPKFGAIVKPGAIKRDSQGNTFIADPNNARIVVLDKEMNLIRSWGGWGDKEGQFKMPSDLAFSGDEKILYVTDPYNFRVQAFDKDGAFLFGWGSPGTEPGQFLYPSSVCVGTDGSVFVSDSAANRIDKFDQRGRAIKQWGAWGTAAGEFYMPGGIGQDEKGRIIVVDLGNDRVEMFSPDGEFIRMFAVGELPHTTAHTHGSQAELMRARSDQSERMARLGSPPAAGMSFLSNAGAYEVKYLAAPTPIPLNERFDLQFSLRERSGQTVKPGTTVQVDAGMPEHHHGMNLKPTVKVNSDGTYTASGLLFHMPGLWQIYFDISRQGATERAQSDVTLD
jgi:DNA-binding beta-propeller fold protein YncE